MKLGIIIGSTRQGRVSDRLAKWVQKEATTNPDLEVTMLDLRDYEMPFFDEEISPQYNSNRQTTGVVKDWLDAVADQDAYVFVTPEYNRSFSAVLKNALDYVAYEMKGKPVGIATHGSANGAQAVTQLRGVIPGVLAISAPTFVGIPYAEMLDFSEDGTPSEATLKARGGAVEGMLMEITNLAKVSQTA